MFFGEKILKKTKFSKEQNSEKNKIGKTEKSKKSIFFLYLLCVHSKFFMRQFYDIILFSKNFFYDFLTPSWYLKFCLKKLFFEKKAGVPKFRKKKKKKKSKN